MLAAVKAQGKTHTSGPIHGIIARDGSGLPRGLGAGVNAGATSGAVGTTGKFGRMFPILLPLEPNDLAQQLQQWRRERIQNEPDPTDYPAFRQHLIAFGAPDPGPDAFQGFAL